MEVDTNHNQFIYSTSEQQRVRGETRNINIQQPRAVGRPRQLPAALCPNYTV